MGKVTCYKWGVGRIEGERERERERENERNRERDQGHHPNLELPATPQAELMFPTLLSRLFNLWPVRGRASGWTAKRLRAKA